MPSCRAPPGFGDILSPCQPRFRSSCNSSHPANSRALGLFSQGGGPGSARCSFNWLPFMNEGKGEVCLFELLPLSDSLGRALPLSLRLLRKYVRTHLSSLADKFRAPGLRAGPWGGRFPSTSAWCCDGSFSSPRITCPTPVNHLHCLPHRVGRAAFSMSHLQGWGRRWAKAPERCRWRTSSHSPRQSTFGQKGEQKTGEPEGMQSHVCPKGLWLLPHRAVASPGTGHEAPGSSGLPRGHPRGHAL